MSHECPRNGCKKTVPDDMLLCAADWRGVTIPLRRALYAAWDNGRGKGTPAHAAAMDAVIRHVNGEPAPSPSPHQLWEQAGGGTSRYSREEYRRLLREHGHLLEPGDEGYEDAPRSLPCGWPGEERDA